MYDDCDHIWDCIESRVRIDSRWSRRMDLSGSPTFWYRRYGSGMGRPVGSGYGFACNFFTPFYSWSQKENRFELQKQLLVPIPSIEQNWAGQRWKIPSLPGIPLDCSVACLSSPAFLRRIRCVARKTFKTDDHQSWPFTSYTIHKSVNQWKPLR